MMLQFLFFLDFVLTHSASYMINLQTFDFISWQWSTILVHLRSLCFERELLSVFWFLCVILLWNSGLGLPLFFKLRRACLLCPVHQKRIQPFVWHTACDSLSNSSLPITGVCAPVMTLLLPPKALAKGTCWSSLWNAVKLGERASD